jgi:phosphate transport system substrate-binding protein
MVIKHRFFNTLTVLSLCSLLLASCGSENKSGEGKEVKKLTGTIRVSGAWALYPMMVRWGEEFKKTHPDVRIDISAGGAGKGIADALASFVDLGMVSRTIKPEEVAKGAVFVPVVKDAVFVSMNTANPSAARIMEKGMTKQSFIRLWIEGKATTWGELASDTNNKALQVYTRSDACGAAETWALYLGKKQEDLKGVGVYGDPGTGEAVLKDTNGIGYNNLNYAFDMKTGLPIAGLKIVPIDVNNNGKIDEQEDVSTKDKAIRAVVAGVYPSPPARDLYLVAKTSFSGPAAAFVRWILTDGQKFVDEVGYVKLSDGQVAEAIKKLGK